MARTKIVATAGPACADPSVLEGMIHAGVDVIRLNMSHGSQTDHDAMISRVRSISDELERPVALLLDLCGPKMRTGPLQHGEPITLREGARFTLTHEDVVGTAERVSTAYKALAQDVKPGDRILLSDGAIELRVVSTEPDAVDCEVVFGGPLGERKGINLPGVDVSAPSVTAKDLDDLRFGLERDVDYVALSFVREADDLRRLLRDMERLGKRKPVIAKIEKPEALDNLAGIMDTADGVMVARGDLGVELSPERVPMAQKRIIREANARGKPVITATQMLESMMQSPRPTRAEASDVANAIMDGTDAVMLSGETAVGRFPARCVEMMERIASETEANVSYWQSRREAEWHMGSTERASMAAAKAAARALDDAPIVVFTLSGHTADLVAQMRPASPIIAFTPEPESYRRLALRWGVQPFMIEFGENTDELIRRGERRLLELGLAEPGQTVVCVAGTTPLRGATNMLKIDTLSP